MDVKIQYREFLEEMKKWKFALVIPSFLSLILEYLGLNLH